MISWDEPKRLSNIEKHGIDLSRLEKVFDYPMITHEDERESYGEVRNESLGWWEDSVVVLIWTERNDVAHLISCRYADRSKTKTYFKRFL